MTNHAATVERKTFYFPSRDTDGIVACAIPCRASAGGFAVADADAAVASWVASLNDAQGTSIRVDLPKRATTYGPIRAIGISPDSLIHTCDVSLFGKDGELDRRVLSPGNPILGTEEADFALITIRHAIPKIGRTSSLAFADAVAVGTADSQDTMGWPLRLELFRGDTLPMRTHQRATQAAHFCGTIDSSTGIQTRTYYVCTDGRRRVSAWLYSSGPTLTFEAYAVEAIKDTGGSQYQDVEKSHVLELDGSGSVSLPTGTDDVLFVGFDSIAPTIMKFVVTMPFSETPVTSEFQLKIRAEDA